MGKLYIKMPCSMTIAALSILGVKTKIALTGVRSSVRESLTNTANLILLTMYFLTATYLFPYKNCFPTI